MSTISKDKINPNSAR